jgi:hypothetical protein
VSSFLASLQPAAVQQTAAAAQPQAVDSAAPALPALPNLFAGRRLRQLIFNPGDLLGLTTDSSKATPSAADAAKLNAALGLQVRLPEAPDPCHMLRRRPEGRLWCNTPAG